MHEAVIVEALRTPVGRHGGALKDMRPDDMAAFMLSKLVQKAGIDPAIVDEVILGCTNQAGEDNRNIARMSALLAGFPKDVCGQTVNRLCASGLTAINNAARMIKVGEGSVFIAGGVESMSRAPYSMPKPDTAFPTGHNTLFDTTLGWRYPNPKMEKLFPLEAMGQTAENIFDKEPDITRELQDKFAMESQRRASVAIETGRFKNEIVPVPAPQRRGDPVLFSEDEHPRKDTTMAKLAALSPAFKKNGTVTAGNSSGINDGAAALLLMSAEKAQQLGHKPLVRIVTSAAAGVDPRTMGYGPIPATNKALARAGLKMSDIGLIELNEAFAVQALACMKALGMRPEITNVNGGAIALGHPVGCSGARLMTTLVHEMKRRAPTEKRPYYGLVSLCVGVGQGETTIVEWIGD